MENVFVSSEKQSTRTEYVRRKKIEHEKCDYTVDMWSDVTEFDSN